MIKTILFPSQVFDWKTVDEDMRSEYEAAMDIGLFEGILFGYDEWFNHGRLKLTEIPAEMTDAVYRGWMMKPEQYAEFYRQLLICNIKLVTTPEMYSAVHIFPSVYPAIMNDTARILTFPLHERIDIEAVKKIFPRFMVKDYVKSVKGTEFPAYFDKYVTQDEFNRWMQVFYNYRGDLLTGGICVKEYLDLKRYAGKTNEYRAYYISHQVATVSRNSLQGNYTPTPPNKLIQKYASLDSVFYTIDFAELEDGSWKIVEAGDGSVSGLSDGQDYQAFYRALYVGLN